MSEQTERKDEELVCLARDGDKQAMDELMLRYAGLVRSCVRGFFLVGGSSVLEKCFVYLLSDLLICALAENTVYVGLPVMHSDRRKEWGDRNVLSSKGCERVAYRTLGDRYPKGIEVEKSSVLVKYYSFFIHDLYFLKYQTFIILIFTVFAFWL